MTPLTLTLYTLAAFCAGITNTIAGGGSFLTFPALLLTGLDARAANITSTLALFPMQISAGYAGRKSAGGTKVLSLRALFLISLGGGLVGAGLLLLTPPAFFAQMVPWLILFATVVFAYGSFRPKPDPVATTVAEMKTGLAQPISPTGSVLTQLAISIYGGYFGGGIGFLMLAALTLAGMKIRQAATTKNILAGAMNASAVAVFIFSADVAWLRVAIGAVASVCGAQVGVRLLSRINEKALRIIVIAIGATMTVVLFVKG